MDNDAVWKYCLKFRDFLFKKLHGFILLSSEIERRLNNIWKYK